MRDSGLIEEFVAVTGAGEQVAEHILEAHDWNLPSSINFYIESGGVGHGSEPALDLTDHEPLHRGSPAPRSRPQPATALPRSSPIEVKNTFIYLFFLVKSVALIQTIMFLCLALNRNQCLFAFVSLAPQISDDEEEDDNLRAMMSTLQHRSSARRHVEDIIDDDLEVDMTNGGSSEEGGGGRRRAGRRPRNAATTAIRAYHNISSGPEEELHEPQEHELADDFPADVDMEEQRMLMATLTGEAYSGRVPNFRTDPRYRPRVLSPGAAERERLRQEQDAAFYESLAEDRRKEEAAERGKREAEESAAAFQRTISSKEASLPPEPPADGEDTVQLMVRFPTGGRLTRRFRASDRLSAVFDFIDVSSGKNGVPGLDIKPGSYNLVSQFPRQVFEEGGQFTLGEANLGHKQAAMFVEIK